MKKILILFIVKFLSRRDLIVYLFNKWERISIQNALWRRSEDDRDKGTFVEKENELLKSTCKRLTRDFL